MHSLTHAPVYLAADVKVEPLVDGWSAWPHLMAPAQQALNLTFRYLPTARSFAEAPDEHVATSADPAMFGGPFLPFPASGVENVRDYIRQTEARRAEAIAFAVAFRAFDLELQEAAKGYSLDSFKEALPDPLRGRVELVYDAHNNPKIRVLEEMFTVDDLGHGAAQGVFLHRTQDANRPFFLTDLKTPDSAGLQITTLLGSDAIQRLCEARQRPVELGELAHDLGVLPETLAPFFTDTPGPPPAPRYKGHGVRVRYFGHACLLIETDAVAILIDPSAARDPLPGIEHLRFDDLPEHIDIVALSHGHQDHFCLELLMQLRARVGTVVIPPSNAGELADPSMKRILHTLGFTSVEILAPLETLTVPDGTLTALPFSGEHSDLDVHAKQCFQVELKGRKISLFIDSDAIDLEVYRRLGHLLDTPDIMFVGMECCGAPLSWLYGPLLSTPLSKKQDQSRRLSGADCVRAWRLAQQIKPRRSFVYAMGQEAWMRSLMGLNYKPDSIQLTESAAFVERCQNAGILSARLHNNFELEI